MLDLGQKLLLGKSTVINGWLGLIKFALAIAETTLAMSQFCIFANKFWFNKPAECLGKFERAWS